VFVMPELRMPAVTAFIDGSGPVFAGSLFPFLFITIACGAVSGWHALISSGTTPKLIASEGEARLVGYGAMLMEAFVAIMALIAACTKYRWPPCDSAFVTTCSGKPSTTTSKRSRDASKPAGVAAKGGAPASDDSTAAPDLRRHA